MRQLQRRGSVGATWRHRLMRDFVSASSCWCRVSGSYSGMSLSLSSTQLHGRGVMGAGEAW